MTKIALFPWAGVVLKEAGVCELLAEQSGFLTGSTFLPWKSVVIPGDEFTLVTETYDDGCGDYGLKYTESFNEGCGDYGLKNTESWES